MDVLPPELLAKIAARLASVEECGRLEFVCRLFGGGLQVSPVELALELRAAMSGDTVAVPREWVGSRRSWWVFKERWRYACALQHRVASAQCHSLWIAEGGSLHSFGINEEGVLGQGRGTRAFHHYRHPDTLSVDLPHVPLVDHPTCVPALVGIQIRSVSVADFVSMALSVHGAVYTWGCGDDGNLGHGNEQDQDAPKLVEALQGETIVAVSAGAHHCMAATECGRVYSWGGIDECYEPREVEALSGVHVVAVESSLSHSMVLSAQGCVYSWGMSAFGCLGHSGQMQVALPKRLELAESMLSIATCQRFSLSLSHLGSVYMWGSTTLHAPESVDELPEVTTPRLVDELRKVTVVSLAAESTGGHHALALTDCGRVYSWGYGQYGVLGHGDETNQCTPKFIESLRQVNAIAAGRYQSIALATQGVYVWGSRTGEEPVTDSVNYDINDQTQWIDGYPPPPPPGDTIYEKLYLRPHCEGSLQQMRMLAVV